MRPLSSIHQDLNRIFYDLEREFMAPMMGRRQPEGMEGLMQTVWAPPVDVAEDEREVRIKASVPGLKPEEIEIDVDNNAISIRGEVRRTEEENRQNFHRREIVEGTFYRQIPLPTEVDPDKAQARFENGMLLINAPKSKQSRRHRIKVNNK